LLGLSAPSHRRGFQRIRSIFGRGGATDSIVDGETGLFYREQSVDSLCDAIRRLEGWLPSFRPETAMSNARRFAPDVFDRGMLQARDALRRSVERVA